MFSSQTIIIIVNCLTFSDEFLRELSSERCLCTTRRPFSTAAIISSRRTWPPAQSTLSDQTRAEKKPESWLIPKLHIVDKMQNKKNCCGKVKYQNMT